MGLLYMAIEMPKSITIGIFSFAIFLLFSALCLYKSLTSASGREEDSISANPNSSYMVMLEGSIIPIPVKLVTRAIKRRVSIIRYSYTQEECQRGKRSVPLAEAAVCTICMELLEIGDEIRELCNCRHLFHLCCLDKWIDVGGVTCPLCRSMLLPPGIRVHQLRGEED